MEKTLEELFSTMDNLVADFKEECEKIQEQIDAKKENEFKKGDFLIAKNRTIKLIFDEYEETWFNSCLNGKNAGNVSWYIQCFRKMTESEKAAFIEEMNAGGKDWDEERLEVVDYVWKPKKREKYWILQSTGITSQYWDDDEADKALFNIFNVFRTQELAQAAYDAQLELRKTLKHY